MRDETGVDLQVLTGDDEARLTFLAVRRWFGWSSGRLMVIDIGGGSLEMAAGIDEVPDAIASLPLGAGRLTRTMLPGDPPKNADVKALRKHVRTRGGRPAAAVRGAGRAGPRGRDVEDVQAAGAADWCALVRRRRSGCRGCCRLADLQRVGAAARRDDVRGPSQAVRRVGPDRAPQLLAGAVVAEAAMDLLDLEEVQVCPWALREGIILRRLDWMSGAT